MKFRIVLLGAAVSAAAVAAIMPSPASADPACAGAQASGLFAVVDVGPACADTPLPTTTHVTTVHVGIESVTVTLATP
jgi:hypothetical protein